MLSRSGQEAQETFPNASTWASRWVHVTMAWLIPDVPTWAPAMVIELGSTDRHTSR